MNLYEDIAKELGANEQKRKSTVLKAVQSRPAPIRASGSGPSLPAVNQVNSGISSLLVIGLILVGILTLANFALLFLSPRLSHTPDLEVSPEAAQTDMLIRLKHLDENVQQLEARMEAQEQNSKREMQLIEGLQSAMLYVPRITDGMPAHRAENAPPPQPRSPDTKTESKPAEKPASNDTHS